MTPPPPPSKPILPLQDLSLTIFIVTPGNWKGGEHVRPIYSVNPSDLGYLPVTSPSDPRPINTKYTSLNIHLCHTHVFQAFPSKSLSFLGRMEVVQAYAFPSVKHSTLSRFSPYLHLSCTSVHIITCLCQAHQCRGKNDWGIGERCLVLGQICIMKTLHFLISSWPNNYLCV